MARWRTQLTRAYVIFRVFRAALAHTTQRVRGNANGIEVSTLALGAPRALAT
jgi:hypothetical protein